VLVGLATNKNLGSASFILALGAGIESIAVICF
jgi:hypothetical protein